MNLTVLLPTFIPGCAWMSGLLQLQIPAGEAAPMRGGFKGMPGDEGDHDGCHGSAHRWDGARRNSDAVPRRLDGVQAQPRRPLSTASATTSLVVRASPWFVEDVSAGMLFLMQIMRNNLMIYFTTNYNDMV